MTAGSAPQDVVRRFPGRPPEATPGYVPGVDETAPTAPAVAPERERAGRWWLAQAISGGLLIVFLGVHLVAQHFLAPGGLRDFAAVVDYLRQPLVVVAELGLAVTVVVHAAIGTRAHLLELIGDRPVMRPISLVIAALGAAIVAYTVWLTATITARPAG